MSPTSCPHADVREFDDMRSCLACGETWFRGHSAETKPSDEIKPYVYSDLRCLEIGQIIRVVVIEPGEESDPLHCTLDLSDLRHTNYHAVSYTWATEDGDDTKSEPIFIDRAPLYVTKNCDAVLRRIRRLGPHSRVWVDAICINQASLKERNHQVGLMDQIYRNAKRVHACIEDPGSDCSDTMQRLASDNLDDVHHSQLVEKLYQCRYFSRVWVIQEIALAKAVTLHVNRCYLDLTDEVVSLVHSLQKGVPAPLRALTIPKSNCSLKTWLRSSRNAACPDPRDRVYAIFSLLSPAERNSIVLDYSRSVEDVFMNAVLVCMANSRNLNVLQSARLDSGEHLNAICGFSIEHFNEHLVTFARPQEEIVDKPQTWKESIHVEDSKGACLFAPFKKVNQISSPVRIMTQIPPSGQILPRLRVRAHRLDYCLKDDGCGISVDAFLKIMMLEKDQRKERKETFDTAGSYPRMAEPRRHHYSPMGMALYATGRFSFSSYNDELFESVFNAIKHFEDQDSDIVFGTRHGLGVFSNYTSSNDCLYLLDGTDQALVLRPLETTSSEPKPASETSCRRFHIIGGCWWQRVCSSSCHFREEDDTFASVTCLSRSGLPSSLAPEFIEVY